MTLKKTISVLLILMLSLLLLGMTALACFFIIVPPYLESKLIPEVAQKAGIELYSLRIRSLGFRGMELSDIRIGGTGNQGLFIDSIRVDYSLRQLSKYNVRQITVSGISADIEYRDDSITVKGLESLFDSKKGESDTGNNSIPEFTIEKISVRNSAVTVNINETTMRLPFEIEADMLTKMLMPDRLSAVIYAEGNRIDITALPEPETDIINLSLWSDNLALENYRSFTHDILPFDLNGSADLNVIAGLDYKTMGLSDVSVSCTLTRSGIDLGGIFIQNPVNGQGALSPVRIHIISKDASKWEFSISEIIARISHVPLAAAVSGSLNIIKDDMDANILLTTRPASSEKDGNQIPYDLSNLPDLEWNIAAKKERLSPIEVHLKGYIPEAKDKGLKLTLPDLAVTGRGPEIEISARLNNSIIEAAYSLDIPETEIIKGDMKLKVSSVTLSGTAGNTPENKETFESAFRLDIHRTGVTGSDMSADLPQAGLSGLLTYEPGTGLKADTHINFENGNFSMTKAGIAVKGIRGNIPVKWPFEDNKPGKILIEATEYGDMKPGRLELAVSQDKKNLNFSGRFYNDLIKGMDLNISGKTALDPVLNEAHINLHLPDFAPASEIDLARFLPAMKGMYLNGLFELTGDLRYSVNGLAGSLILKIDNAGLHDSAENIALEGIFLNLELTDLPGLKSAPGQRLKIEKISYMDIRASDLTMDFQIESIDSLLVEKGRFKWCEGHVNLQAVRIIPERNDYDLTLFCDRLNLADVLGQFGVIGAAGEGAVNGRIPIRFYDGHIVFEDGFLYSTPGDKGKISITNTGILTAGLQPGSRESQQMEIAAEALKDFEYSWVKLGLNSIRDDLMVKLQFDGKPSGRLPFWYNRKEGSFVRVEPHLEGSDFQGFNLSINFQVPLDNLLNYKDIWSMIE